MQTLAERMKTLEDRFKIILPSKQPIIVRIDGKNFSKYTKQEFIEKPFSELLNLVFQQTTLKVCNEIQNIEFAYHQSDEVSFFLKDYNLIKTEQIYNGSVQKISSIFASTFTYYFNEFIKNKLYNKFYDGITVEISSNSAIFDARTISLPLHEINNYFVWRQRDAIKNSITNLSLHYFSVKELFKKNSDEKKAMLRGKNIIWDELPTSFQRGSCFKKTEVELIVKDNKEVPDNILLPETVIRHKYVMEKTPIFSENPDFINELVYSGEGIIPHTTNELSIH